MNRLTNRINYAYNWPYFKMLKFLSIQFLKLCKLTNKCGDLLYAVACDNIPYCMYRGPFTVLIEQTNGAPLKDF